MFIIYSKTLDKPKGYSCHRFIFECIRGLIPEGFDIHHKNSIRTDNRISNLELLTHQENTHKALNKSIIAINIESKEEKTYINITSASIELTICFSFISEICNKKIIVNQRLLKMMVKSNDLNLLNKNSF